MPPEVIPPDERRHRIHIDALSMLGRIADKYEARNRDTAARAMGIVKPGDEPVVLQGRDAAQALARAQVALEELANQYVNRLPSWAWLAHLRDLPVEVWGDMEFQALGAREERRWIAEELSAHSSASPAQPLVDAFPLGLVLRFALLSRGVANAIILRRVAAKDVPLRFMPGEWPDRVEGSPEVRALEVFDERRDAATAWNALTGTGTMTSDHDAARMVERVFHLSPRPLRSDTDMTTVDIDGRLLHDWAFHPRANTIHITSALSQLAWHHDHLPSALLLHHVAFTVLIDNPEAYIALCRTGSLLFHGTELREQLDAALQGERGKELVALFPGVEIGALTVDRVLEDGLTLPTSVPSSPGAVLGRALDDSYLFDMVASMRRIGYLLTPTSRSGTAHDVRAHDFEELVQRTIDRSKWKPAYAVRSLRGRNLTSSVSPLIAGLAQV